MYINIHILYTHNIHIHMYCIHCILYYMIQGSIGGGVAGYKDNYSVGGDYELKPTVQYNNNSDHRAKQRVKWSEHEARRKNDDQWNVNEASAAFTTTTSQRTTSSTLPPYVESKYIGAQPDESYQFRMTSDPYERRYRR